MKQTFIGASSVAILCCIGLSGYLTKPASANKFNQKLSYHDTNAILNNQKPSLSNEVIYGNNEQIDDPNQLERHLIYQPTTSDATLPVVDTASIGGADLNTAAGHHHGHSHGKYYEYREVPKKKHWKFGYKRGNHKHWIMRHEHGKNGKHPHFKTKVKWADKKSKGKGVHIWDYNHHDKKHHYHG